MQKLKLTKLPRWISEIHLKQFFHSCGKIIEAKIELDPSTLRPLGSGYLIFADQLAIDKALAKDGCLLDGSAIKVEIEQESQVIQLENLEPEDLELAE